MIVDIGSYQIELLLEYIKHDSLLMPVVPGTFEAAIGEMLKPGGVGAGRGVDQPRQQGDSMVLLSPELELWLFIV